MNLERLMAEFYELFPPETGFNYEVKFIAFPVEFFQRYFFKL